MSVPEIYEFKDKFLFAMKSKPRSKLGLQVCRYKSRFRFADMCLKFDLKKKKKSVLKNFTITEGLTTHKTF